MNYNKIIQKFDSKHFSNKTSNQFQIGQVLKLGIKIQEGEKYRIQQYKGVLISKKTSYSICTLRVRKIFQKVGVERIFPLASKQIQFIEILSQSQAKVRRSKLYFLRSRIGKQSIIKD